MEGQSSFLRNMRLVLRKEGASDIQLAHGSGATEEEAVRRCAEGIITHLRELEDFLQRAEKLVEEATVV